MRVTLNNIAKYKYYSLAKELFKGKYKCLSNDSRVIYAWIMDRLSLSIKNKWVNEKDEVYVNVKRKSLCYHLELSKGTVQKCFEQLRDIDLIDYERVYNKQADRIYPHNIKEQDFEQMEMDIEAEDEQDEIGDESKKEKILKQIKDNIHYVEQLAWLNEYIQRSVKEEAKITKTFYNLITNTLFETVLGERKFNIGEFEYTAKELRSKFLELEDKHIWSVVEGLKAVESNTVKNKKPYIVAALFNSFDQTSFEEGLATLSAIRDFKFN